MLVMLQRNPALVSAGDTTDQEVQHPRRIAGANAATEDSEQGLHVDDLGAALPMSFTYIPNNQEEQYSQLLCHCLAYDLEMMATLPEDEEVSLGILSTKHLELLSECALRWRISSSWRNLELLDGMLAYFSSDAVPFECLIEVFEGCMKLAADEPITTWPIKHVST